MKKKALLLILLYEQNENLWEPNDKIRKKKTNLKLVVTGNQIRKVTGTTGEICKKKLLVFCHHIDAKKQNKEKQIVKA